MRYDISSPSNERIKWLVRLRDRRHRDAEGVFVIEGERHFRRAVETGLTPVAVFVDTDPRSLGYETITVEPDVLSKASYRTRSEGLIAVFPQMDTRLQRIQLSDAPLVLIADHIEKPGNLGAMVRTAAAAGADAVLATSEVDLHNPNLIRASTGAVFEISVAVAVWSEIAPWLADHDIDLVVATPDSATSHWDIDFREPVAIVIGSEDAGVSETARRLADHTTAIPQRTDIVDSLNASVAAGVLLFEAMRQRVS